MDCPICGYRRISRGESCPECGADSRTIEDNDPVEREIREDRIKWDYIQSREQNS